MSKTYADVVARHAQLEPRKGYHNAMQLLPLSCAEMVLVLRQHPDVAEDLKFDPSRLVEALTGPIERGIVATSMQVRIALEAACARALLPDVITYCDVEHTPWARPSLLASVPW